MNKKEELEAVMPQEPAESQANPAPAEEPEAAQSAEAAEAAESAVASADEPAEEQSGESAEPAGEPTEESNEAAEEPNAESFEADEEPSAAESEKPDKKKKKKKRFFIQIPVLVSLVIVLLAVAGYFIYNAYFLHLPQGILWSRTDEGITFYYEFTDDHMFKTSYASMEDAVSYEEVKQGDEDVIRLCYPTQSGSVHYEDYRLYMSGSRCLKNQKLTLTDAYGNDVIDVDEVEEQISVLELPTEPKTDSKLIGKWVSYRDNSEYYVWFNADGSMRIEMDYHYEGYTYIQAYNVTYTVADGEVLWTLASVVDDKETGKPKIQYDVIPDPYTLEGNQLIFIGIRFERVAEDATPDEA